MKSVKIKATIPSTHSTTNLELNHVVTQNLASRSPAIDLRQALEQAPRTTTSDTTTNPKPALFQNFGTQCSMKHGKFAS